VSIFFRDSHHVPFKRHHVSPRNPSIRDSRQRVCLLFCQATLPWTTIATLGCGYKLLHFATPMK